MKVGGAYPLYASIKNPFDIEKRYAYKELGEIVDRIAKDKPEVADRLREFWNPDNFITEAGYGEDIPGEGVYRDILEHLTEQTFSRDNTKAEVNEVLRLAGFDGITHIGGSNTNNAPHRVFIAFDPGQAKSAIANRGTWDRSNPTCSSRLPTPASRARAG